MRMTVPADGTSPEIYVRNPGDNYVLTQMGIEGNDESIELTDKQLLHLAKHLIKHLLMVILFLATGCQNAMGPHCTPLTIEVPDSVATVEAWLCR